MARRIPLPTRTLNPTSPRAMRKVLLCFIQLNTSNLSKRPFWFAGIRSLGLKQTAAATSSPVTML